VPSGERIRRKGRHGVFAGKTVRSMPERFEIYIVYKRRYINTLPFLFSYLTANADRSRHTNFDTSDFLATVEFDEAVSSTHEPVPRVVRPPSTIDPRTVTAVVRACCQ